MKKILFVLVILALLVPTVVSAASSVTIIDVQRDFGYYRISYSVGACDAVKFSVKETLAVMKVKISINNVPHSTTTPDGPIDCTQTAYYVVLVGSKYSNSHVPTAQRIFVNGVEW